MKRHSGEIIVADRIFQWKLSELPGNLMLTIQYTNCKNTLEAYFDLAVSQDDEQLDYETTDYTNPQLLERIIRNGMKIGWATDPFYPQDLRVSGAEYMSPKRK
jgi:hypothetical protein